MRALDHVWVGGVIVLSLTEEIKRMQTEIRELDARVHVLFKKYEPLPPHIESYWKYHLTTCKYIKENQ